MMFITMENERSEIDQSFFRTDGTPPKPSNLQLSQQLRTQTLREDAIQEYKRCDFSHFESDQP